MYCGNWNAYLASSKTKEIAIKRFNEVPEEFKAQVRSHMKTVKQIKNRKK